LSPWLPRPARPPRWAGGAPAAGGGGDLGGISSGRQQSPERKARAAYHRGLKSRKDALRRERRAASAGSDARREKELGKAATAWQKAIRQFSVAIKNDRRMPEAYNELGYALRKTGHYERALKAYEAALYLRPDYYDAIEYRGEAFLHLGRLDDVKQTYMALFRKDRSNADLLMKALGAWSRDQDMAHADDTLRTFLRWISERQALAAQSDSLSANNARRWD